MGMNIMVYRRTPDGMKRDEDWDSVRLSGDRDFIDQIMDTDYEHYVEGEAPAFMDDRDTYMRPRREDLAALRAWVQATVFEGNRPRLLKLMDRWESGEDIWLYLSL